MAATLGYGGYQIMQGNMSPGNFMVFLLAIVAAYKPMKNVASLHMRMQMGVASMQRLFSMLDVEPSIKDAPDAKELVVSKGKIEFKNITFSYDGERDVLQNVSLTVEPDQTVALVGHSGSGKSTLINFLPRFYDPDKGQILIDGQDITQVTLESLRKHTAYVSQEVILFNDTIKIISVTVRPAQQTNKLLKPPEPPRRIPLSGKWKTDTTPFWANRGPGCPAASAR